MGQVGAENPFHMQGSSLKWDSNRGPQREKALVKKPRANLMSCYMGDESSCTEVLEQKICLGNSKIARLPTNGKKAIRLPL